MKKLTIYKTDKPDVKEPWFIRIRNARNGRIIADGSEGYASFSSAVRAARNNWKDGYRLLLIGHSATVRVFKMVPRAGT